MDVLYGQNGRHVQVQEVTCLSNACVINRLVIERGRKGGGLHFHALPSEHLFFDNQAIP